MLIGVRLLKTVLDTVLCPSFLDALFLEWNLLNKPPGPSGHLLTVTHTAAEVLSKQVVRGWYVRGGNLIANVIERGKNEIPPLF